MRKLRVGYQPLSPDLTQPGDRRRVVFWAKQRGHKIITDLNEPVDVILLSERADLGAFSRKRSEVPVILDLVDGYLSKEEVLKDWFRGTSKVLVGQLSGRPKPFTKFVENLCSNVAAVICSSPEQRETIKPFSKNIHVILDSHEELPLIPFGNQGHDSNYRVLWEGMPATIGGLKQIESALSATYSTINFNLDFVTNTRYFRLLGKFFEGETSSLLKQNLGQMHQKSSIIPWSVENLISTAKSSDVAIIPINLSIPLQYLKPENRLLIMWRLGIPCLTSASPAYIRVASQAGSDTICHSVEEWQTKLTWLLQDAESAEATVQSGQAYIKEFHNGDLILEKWDKAIASVL